MMMKEGKKYYKVECKCGHAGSRNYCIWVDFAIRAGSAREAAVIGRAMPRCKHHHKDAIRTVVEISQDEYMRLLEENHNDPFLKCHSIQEQNQYDLRDRIEEDTALEGPSWKYKHKERSRRNVFINKEKIRNPKSYLRVSYHEYEEEYLYED